MKLVGNAGNGYWYQSFDAPPVFVPKSRAFYRPTDNAYYAWGAVAPGRPSKQGHYVKLMPGGSVVYAQRPGAPPMVLPPSYVQGGQSGLGVVGGGFALHYKGGIMGTLTNPDTGLPTAPGQFISNNTYRTTARQVTTVFLVQESNEMYLLVVAPGVQVDLPVTAFPLEEWLVPWGKEVIIDGILVDDDYLLYFNDTD